MPGKLIYTTLQSLDGYIADAEGNFDWAAPDDEVHAFVNELERSIGTHLYGRRLYEVMAFWETSGDEPDEPPVMHDYAAIWRAADKIVYSRTLTKPSSDRTRIEQTFEPDVVERLKAEATADLAIGGATLAAEAMRAGLVDEYRCVVSPVIVGGGTRALPDGLRADLELLEEQRFAGGAVYLRYAAR